MIVDTETTTIAALPAIGATYAEGIFAGIISMPSGTHAAVILLPNKAQERLDWNGAKSWAESAGGQLPTRPVAAMLFANLKDQFEDGWHWAADEYSSSYAWTQFFLHGNQYFGLKSYEALARAVRMIPLTA